MKTAKFIIGAATMICSVACARPSDVTKIVGQVAEEGGGEVHIVVKKMGVDTLVPVENGKFACELPADITALGSISADNIGVMFIPDGTVLNVTLSSNSSKIESSEKFVQHSYSKYNEFSEALGAELEQKVKDIRANVVLPKEEIQGQIEEVYGEIMSRYNEYNVKAVSENADNAIALVALRNLEGGQAEKEQMESAVNSLSEVIASDPYVDKLKKTMSAQKATAEGQMFTDFTIENSNGKTVRFSDYVGKGKYVLVDFWASWCGPCKMEIPNIKAVYEKYRGDRFDVLSVAVWDRPENTIASAKEHGVVWSQIINAQAVPTEIYGIEGIPHIMLIGPDGVILKRNLRGEGIEKAVAEYLK